ncbi:DNRLRE domain-containing protein [Saccharothrix deserti]|uniref:DNRLRE domain-containing protein n=1 Tax=Saccharothrix deserti TaxID=2593674 RepID=UPI00192E55C1|nr:DNRLRE domain-containing protein [Saccharothrix deserti]
MVAPRSPRRTAFIATALVAVLVAAGAETVRPPAATAAPTPPAPARVDSRPDVTSAAVTARAQGSKVEVESLRTQTSTTWANPDGTMTTDEHAGAVRFRTAEGRWKDVDLTWRRGRDGTVAPGGHPLGVKLGKQNGKAGGLLVAAAPDDAREVRWDAPWPLPEPTLDGTTARYADVEPGVDFVVHTRRSGFEYDFVVKHRPATAPVWRVPLRTKGLTARQEPDGSIAFLDAEGRTHSSIPVAYMWDAEVDKRSGEPVNRAEVDLRVEDDHLVVTPDASWFLDAKRSYPVTVDPTYAVANAFPNFDTWVQSDYTSDQSGSAELKLGTYNGGAVKARSFLNVPVAPFKGKQILSASLSLFETWSYSCTPSTMVVRSAQLASTATRWTAQPTIGSQYGSTSVAKGHDSGCPAGRMSVPVTPLVQAWSNASYTVGGMVLMAGNEADSNSWKRFHSSEGSADPYISYTYNRPPATPATPTTVNAVSYAAPGGASYLYTANRRTWVSSKGTDADGNNVRYEFEFHTSTTTSATTLKATCTSSSYPSGTTAGCQPNADLPDNTAIVVRARTTDGTLRSGWSGWALVRIAATTPAVPTVSCPYANGSWTDTPPTADITCTITATGTGWSAPGYVRVNVDAKPYPTNFAGGPPGHLKITPTSTGGTGKATVVIPKTAGQHSIAVRAETPSGLLSGLGGYSFGYGGSTLSSPAVNPRTTTTGGVRITASGPPKGSSSTISANVRWRVSGYGGASETTGWNTTTNAPLTVTDNGTAGVSVTGNWNTAAETQDGQLDADPNTAGIQPTPLNDRVPVLLDVQVCLAYSASTQCTWSQSRTTVLRVPHAFGNGFPTAEAGPGQVALWTGEFNLDTTDVSVPGYTGELTLSRSHSTFAGATDVVDGVFGPGWTAQLDGAEGGVAGMRLVDNTRVDGTIALLDGDGTALVYESPAGARRTTATLQAGTWLPADEETALDAGKLTVSGTGAATTIAYTEDDGTVTTFATTSAGAPTTSAAGKFRPTAITEPGVPGKTTYTYDTTGRVTRVLAPSAPGIVCTDAQGGYTNAVGCRSLRLEYGTSGSANGRLVAAWLDIFNPDRGEMDAVKVAAYTYDTAGRLATATDPRNNLTTTYGYDSGSRLTSVKPAGQVPFQLAYTAAPEVKLANVKRDRPAGDPTGGVATLASFVYDVPTTGAGLPDLSATSVERWNQAAVPVKGFAVFGPDHPVASTSPSAIAATDWEHADLQYTDAQGYTVNTAKFGAGAWQHTATDYNTQGNVVRELDERALRQVIDGQLPSGATVDQLAALTVYNGDIKSGETVVTPAGTLVTDTYGPARTAALRDGTTRWLRTHTRTEFDQGAPNGGVNPASTLPYRLPTTETTYAHDPGTGEDVEVVSRSFTDYAPPVPGDPDGWALSLPGRVTTDVDLDGVVSSGDTVKTTRYDAEGRVVEARQPNSSGTDAGTTRTAYYTAGANGECGDKPQWAGLVCKTQPAAAPSSGPTLPTTTTTAYTYLLSPATVVETSGAVTRTTATTYLPDGRTASTSTSVTGLPDSTPNTRKETEYDPLTGAATKVTAKNPDGSVAATITTGHDSWGRQTTYQPSGESPTTTTYDAAGSIATVTDANGTTRYTYDGTDAAGRAERRGLTTKVEVTTGGSTWTSTGAYDADGGLTTEELPGGVTRHTELDNAGEPVGRRYTGQVTVQNEDDTTTVDPDGGWLAWSQDNDVTGRVVREWTPEGSAFTDSLPQDRSYAYDAAGRLARVQDRAAGCVTRSYGFDVNDNRLTKTTTPPAADGSCAGTGGSTTTRTFDTADRPATGYAYDPLGRTLTLPAADAPNPQDGDITLAYHDNDLARSITQGGRTTTFTLDALDRRATETVADAAGSTTTVRHYTAATDKPTWVTENGASRRHAELVDGNLSLTVDQSGAGQLTLANSHDDIVATVDLPRPDSPGVGIQSWSSYDEFGAPTGATGRYGWLGAEQRATSSTGLLLMGVRLYNPATGLFTSVDPVPGGNSTAYAYPSDPVNQVDLDGKKKWWKKKCGWCGRAAGVVSHVATAVGMCTNARCQAVSVGLGLASAGLYGLAGRRSDAYSELATTAFGAALGGRGRMFAKSRWGRKAIRWSAKKTLRWGKKARHFRRVVHTRQGGLYGRAWRRYPKARPYVALAWYTTNVHIGMMRWRKWE